VLKLRRFKQEDMKAVLKLNENFPPRSRSKLTQAQIKEWSSNPDACWVAEEEGRIIAFVFGEVKGTRYVVHSAQVSLERIGEGILAKLLDKAIASTKCKLVVKL